MEVHTDDTLIQLQNLCASVGLKVVYTPCLPKAPINGAARWINQNKTPLIQLSCRHKVNDIFWFSFFHELGHILLHGVKDIFLENVEYDQLDALKEKEADQFAEHKILSRQEEKILLRDFSYSRSSIEGYSKQFNLHPGIIVGRLQHRGLVSKSRFNDLKAKITLPDN